MITTLTKYGDSYALVLDASLLDSLGIRPDTPLTVVTDGQSLVVTPPEEDVNDRKFDEILERINNRYANVFRRLAE